MSTQEHVIHHSASSLLAVKFKGNACNVCGVVLKTVMAQFYHWILQLSPQCPDFSRLMNGQPFPILCKDPKCKDKEVAFNDDAGLHRHRVRYHDHVPRTQGKQSAKRERTSDDAEEDADGEQDLDSTSTLSKPPRKRARKSKVSRSRRNVQAAPLASTSRRSPPIDPPSFGSHSRMTSNSTAPLATPPPPPISSFGPPLFVVPGQTALDGFGYSALGQQAYDGYGQPSLGGFGQPAFDGLGQAPLDAYGRPPVDEFDLSAFNGFVSCPTGMPNWDDPALWTSALPVDEAGLDFGAFMTSMDAPALDMTAPAMDLPRHPIIEHNQPAQLAEPSNEPAPPRAMPHMPLEMPPPPREVPPSPRASPTPPGHSSYSRGSHGARSSRGVNPEPPRGGDPRHPRTMNSSASRTFHPYARPSTRRRPPSDNPIKFAGFTFSNFDGTNPNPAFAAGPSTTPTGPLTASTSRLRTERAAQYPPVPPPNVDAYSTADLDAYATRSYQGAPTMDFYVPPTMHTQQRDFDHWQQHGFEHRQQQGLNHDAQWMSSVLPQGYQQEQHGPFQQQVFEPRQQILEPQQTPFPQQPLDSYGTQAIDFDANATEFTDIFWPDLTGAPMPEFSEFPAQV
ncbi:hypothetical protein GGF50DRAFT_91359 [Schizophyllum commune]